MFSAYIQQIYIFFRIIIPTHCSAYIILVRYTQTRLHRPIMNTSRRSIAAHYSFHCKLSACGRTLRSSNQALQQVLRVATKVHSYAKVALTEVHITREIGQCATIPGCEVLRCCVYLLRSAIRSNKCIDIPVTSSSKTNLAVFVFVIPASCFPIYFTIRFSNILCEKYSEK